MFKVGLKIEETPTGVLDSPLLLCLLEYWGTWCPGLPERPAPASPLWVLESCVHGLV